MSRYVYRYLAITLLTLSLNVISQPSAVAQPNGEAIFKANCTSCHQVSDQTVVGPGLKNVHKKYSEEWLLKWIKNSQSLVKAGDPDAVKVFEKFNKVPMPAFGLKEDELKAVIGYIKTESEKVPVGPVAATPGAAAQGAPVEDNTPLTLMLVTILLVGLYVILNKVKKGLEQVMRQREGLPEPVALHGKAGVKSWIREHKKLIALLLIIGAVWSSVVGWNTLAGIGISQGYAPDQPIKFSHALHVTQNKIDCRYCHSGAEKSKNAGIPSPNLCMNCHKYVQVGPKYGKDEIAKIYSAIGWDPSTSQYSKPQKAIEWVRIHNLPDLAYFNHSQHTVVGKVACETCHGPVGEMEVMNQFSPLTMGWCINCHRTTEVKAEGNAYYDKVHAEFKKKYGAEAKMTVDKIGGTECARCHY